MRTVSVWVTAILAQVLLASCSSTTRSGGTEVGAGGEPGQANDTGGLASGGAGGDNPVVGETGGTGGLGAGGDPGVGMPDEGECVEETTRSCAATPLNRVGACALDTAVCEDGEWVGCPESKGNDSCEPGNDNNCNGQPNEGCTCENGDVQSCGHSDVGVCKPGTSTCGDSEWGPCVGNIDPGQRDCSSADDNDCDGSPDDTRDDACQCEVGTVQPCDEHPGLDGTGPCKAGSQTCVLSADKTTSEWGPCTGSVGPASADTCDPGNDDNCNDELNEGCPCVNGDTQPCGHATVGICKRGVSTCENSEWQPCEGNVEPKPRDCSSPLDNDCDGTADDTNDATCQCTPGDSQACGAHPGLDGNGPCKAGSQSCVLADDNTSSYWGSCAGSVGPAASDNCNPNNDNNCNGTKNDGCSCVNGTQMTCECGSPVICTNGTLPACPPGPVLRYQDADDDGFGDPNISSQVCPSESGWADNDDDCDDDGASIKPNWSDCGSDDITRYWCPASGGVLGTQTCAQGCSGGACRSDGTIGVPGKVSCSNSSGATITCDAEDACCFGSNSCGSCSGNPIFCDGPNDCPSGQECYIGFDRAGLYSQCSTSSSNALVCDPLAPSCANCLPYATADDRIYTCQ